MASAVGGAGGRALEAAAGAVAAVEDQMVKSPAASGNLPMAPGVSASLAGEGVGAAVGAMVTAEVVTAVEEAPVESPEGHLLGDSTPAF